MKRITIVFGVCMCFLILMAGCGANPPETPDETKLSYYAGFDTGNEGFEAIFADYIIDSDGLEKYEMVSGYAKMPTAGDENHGLYIASHNRSDDMFMGFVKELSGYKANTKYTFDISFVIATNTESGLVGIGGAPGESVFVKAGLASEYPQIETAEDGVERIANVDIGIQSKSGKDVVLVGNMAKPEGSAEGFVLKEMKIRRTVLTNEEGSFFLVIGTDSGFEGFTEYYLDDVNLLYIGS